MAATAATGRHPAAPLRYPSLHERFPMLKILYKPDALDNVESNLVAEAANRLEVGEFQVFQLGYFAWFGCEIEAKALENAFFGYLLENQVPHWVRHFARRIVQLDDQGGLHPYAPEYHRYDRNYAPPTHVEPAGIVKVLAVLLLVGAVLLAVIVSAGNVVPKGVNCLYPPCYWDKPAQSQRAMP